MPVEVSSGRFLWVLLLSCAAMGARAVITEVRPPQLPLTKFARLNLIIDDLDHNGELHCEFQFSYSTFNTRARRQSYGVDCDTPDAFLLPKVPAGHHQLKATINLRTAEGNLVDSTDFIFFDCGSYSTCTECASSAYSCDWCMEANRCTSISDSYCPNDIVVASNSSVTPASGSCLSFHSKTDSNEILIHSGLKSIAVKAHIPVSFVVQSRFLCEFIIEDTRYSVSAQLLADTIYCDNFEFTYTSSAPQVTASLNILWGGGTKKLDNPDNVHVVIYRCNTAQDCSTCFSMPEKYQCGWCRPGVDAHENIKECRLQDSCSFPYEWYSQNQTCPDIEIHSFMPHSGPWEGGTKVTINGLNLGTNVSDIKEVIVGGTSCDVIPELYVKTKRIVCTTRLSEEDRRLGEGPVYVRVGEYSRAANVTYDYVDPEVRSIEPTYGSILGGVLLRIEGDYLDAGSDTKVMICDSPCEIVATERQVILCKTPAANEVKNCSLSVHFDKAVRHLSKGQFEYTEDPIILAAYSGLPSSNKQPKGTPKGGMIIKVLGRNLRGVQSPNIRVYYNNKSYKGNCYHYQLAPETELRCYAPRILIRSPINPEHPLELEYDFILDDVVNAKNLYRENGPYLMYPNPTIEGFDGIRNITSDTEITLHGDNLDWVSSAQDLSVTVGYTSCKVTSLSRHELTFRAPPLSELQEHNIAKVFDVSVRVGRRHWLTVGKVTYREN